MPTHTDQPSLPKLADFLCFSVYSANLAYGRAYAPIMEELGVTYPQWIAIVALWEEDSQTVSNLGKKMFLESNTLTPILKNLEALGFVTRTRNPNDQRQVIISLTKAGRALREKGAHRTLLEASGLSVAEFQIVQKAMVRLRDNLLGFAKKEV